MGAGGKGGRGDNESGIVRRSRVSCSTTVTGRGRGRGNVRGRELQQVIVAALRDEDSQITVVSPTNLMGRISNGGRVCFGSSVK